MANFATRSFVPFVPVEVTLEQAGDTDLEITMIRHRDEVAEAVRAIWPDFPFDKGIEIDPLDPVNGFWTIPVPLEIYENGPEVYTFTAPKQDSERARWVIQFVDTGDEVSALNPDDI